MEELRFRVNVNGSLRAAFLLQPEAAEFVDGLCSQATIGTDISLIDGNGVELLGFDKDGNQRTGKVDV